MDNFLLQDIVGWTAFTFYSYFLLYPILPFLNVIKGKLNYEEAPGTYVTLNYINCYCWYIYGQMIFSEQIKLIYLIGVISSGIFVSIYLYFELKKYVIDTFLNSLILGSGSYMVYLSFTVIIDDDTLIGKICTGTHCLLYFFPIRNIYRVMKQKNFMLISFYRAWGSLFNSILWIIYGILIQENYVVLPHCFNIILEPVQIILFLNYRKKYPIIEDKEDFSPTIDIESSENENKKKEKEPKVNEINNGKEENVKERPVIIVGNETN